MNSQLVHMLSTISVSALILSTMSSNNQQASNNKAAEDALEVYIAHLTIIKDTLE